MCFPKLAVQIRSGGRRFIIKSDNYSSWTYSRPSLTLWATSKADLASDGCRMVDSVSIHSALPLAQVRQSNKITAAPI
jgi:hypothetical protein